MSTQKNTLQRRAWSRGAGIDLIANGRRVGFCLHSHGEWQGWMCGRRNALVALAADGASCLRRLRRALLQDAKEATR